MKKIIITDYDKTLYLNDEDIKNNIKYIEKFRNNNNLFVIATGRAYSVFEDKIELYNIPYDYILLNHGAVIINNKKEIIYRELIDKENLINIINVIQTLPVIEIVLFDELDRFKTINDNITKIMIRFETRELVEKSYKILNEKFKNIFNMYLINSKNNRIEIISKKTNKAVAIKKLEEYENIKKEYTYTIGDSSNDVEMIKEYNGFGMTISENSVYDVASKLYDGVSLLIEDILNEKI